jgi:hypothetical protein
MLKMTKNDERKHFRERVNLRIQLRVFFFLDIIQGEEALDDKEESPHSTQTLDKT